MKFSWILYLTLYFTLYFLTASAWGQENQLCRIHLEGPQPHQAFDNNPEAVQLLEERGYILAQAPTLVSEQDIENLLNQFGTIESSYSSISLKTGLRFLINAPRETVLNGGALIEYESRPRLSALDPVVNWLQASAMNLLGKQKPGKILAPVSMLVEIKADGMPMDMLGFHTDDVDLAAAITIEGVSRTDFVEKEDALTKQQFDKLWWFQKKHFVETDFRSGRRAFVDRRKIKTAPLNTGLFFLGESYTYWPGKEHIVPLIHSTPTQHNGLNQIGDRIVVIIGYNWVSG